MATKVKETRQETSKESVKTLAQLKEVSVAFVNEIDNIMISQSKGQIDSASGARILGETVQKFSDILKQY